MSRILLVGGDADFNVGDAAIRHAICVTLAQADHSARISIVSASRSPSALPPGVSQVLPKGLRHGAAQWRAARTQDLIIVGGGGLFQDDDSRIKMPWWAGRLAALRGSGTPIAGHCIGAGPLAHRESRLMARMACATMRSVTVRDEFARRALQPCTSRALSVVPDPAFMLEPRADCDAAQWLQTLGVPAGRPLIGVALRRWFHVRGGFLPHRVRAGLGWGADAGSAPMSRVLGSLARVLQDTARDMDAGVLMLPSYLAAHEGDIGACAALAARLHGVPCWTAQIADPRLYKAVTGRLGLLVSARMHPLILAAGMGTPIVGLAYNGKFGGCMQALGGASQLLRIEQLALEGGDHELAQCIGIALRNGERIRQRAESLAVQARGATRQLLELLP